MKFIPFIISIMLIGCTNTNAPKTESKTSDTELIKLFIGTYTETEAHVDGKANGISMLHFDPEKGLISNTSISVDAINPSYLAIDPENERLYCVNEKTEGEQAISSFLYTNEKIEPLNKKEIIGGAPCHIIKENNLLLVSNYVGGNFEVYKTDEKGAIENLTDQYNIAVEGKAAHKHSMFRHPNKPLIFGADLGLDQVLIYKLEEGKLILEQIISLPEGSGPRHLTFHKTKDICYVVNELNGTINTIRFIGDAYQITQTIPSTKIKDKGPAYCADIHIHPNNQYLYASNRGKVNTISGFHIDDDGVLSNIGEWPSRGIFPRSFAIDPSGNFLLVANQNSDNIIVYAINGENGLLENIIQEFNTPTPVCLKFE